MTDTGKTFHPQVQRIGDVAASEGGITLRQWYAGLALNTVGILLAEMGGPEEREPQKDSFAQNVAKAAFEIADAMIKEGGE